MAVFTAVNKDELADWLGPLNCGSLTGLEGIESGIENTNYFVDTTQGRYVLTIFEKLGEHELPFYLNLMGHLAHKGLPVPQPAAGPDGALFRTLKGKPATLVNCLKGRSVTAPSAAQCEAIGEFSAKAHLAVGDFAGGNQPNPRGLAWITQAAIELDGHLPSALSSLLADEIAHQQSISTSLDYEVLPRGAVHADLFRDNALMQGEQLGGVIDFYFAGVDTFLFDMAVTINDWCINHDTGALVDDLLAGFMRGYTAVRPLAQAEQNLFNNMLRAAALRFWTSRLVDYYMPRKAEVLNTKDPTHFERVLTARRAL